MVIEHKTTRRVPAGKSSGSLMETMTNALGDKCAGYRTERDGYIIIVLNAHATDTDLNTAIQIVETHNFDTLTSAEQAAAEDAARKTAAKTTAAAIPAWATFTEAQALAWLDGHVSSTQVNAISSLAEAKVVLADMATLNRALVRLVVALRDHTWPELPREV